jgi:hypothetical protein
MLLTEARAMVVREYLVANFGFDDSQLKTLGMGKQTNTNSEGDWGTVQIFIYRVGTEHPRNKVTTANSSPNASVQPAQASSAAAPKAQE